MKARKKELKEIPLADLGVDATPRVKIVKLEPPPKRQGGRKVESVQELVQAPAHRSQGHLKLRASRRRIDG